MSISMSSASLPILTTMLGNLNYILDKAQANADERKFDSSVLLQSRLAPDMLPFSKQVQIACDVAKLGVARLAGIEAPKFDDNELTLADLKARIQKTLDFLATVSAAQLDGSEEKSISFKPGGGAERHMQGEAYLKLWVLPNHFFHVTTAYAILRHNGVPLGKMDYLVGAPT